MQHTAVQAMLFFTFFFFHPPADGAKIKLKLTTLPRIFIRVVSMRMFLTGTNCSIGARQLTSSPPKLI